MLPEFLLIRQCIPWKFRKTHQTLEFGTKFKFQTMFNLLPELLIGNWMISMLDIRYIKFMMKIFFVFPLNIVKQPLGTEFIYLEADKELTWENPLWMIFFILTLKLKLGPKFQGMILFQQKDPFIKWFQLETNFLFLAVVEKVGVCLIYMNLIRQHQNGYNIQM